MSGNVLFDAPGPRTIARHRLYSVLTWLALLAVIGFFVWRMQVTGQLEYDKWEVFLTPAYVEVILQGLLDTLQMAFGAIIFAVVFGLVFGVGKMSDHGWVRWPCWVIVEFFRAVPVLMLMIFLFYLLAVGDAPLSPMWCVIIALTLYNGSVLAEVFRAGVNAVPRGQVEAAYALGMRKTQVMVQIQLPQAVKMMLPALISQCVVALKDTSLGSYIIAPGLTFVYKQITLDFKNQVPTALVITAIYILVNLVLTAIATALQRRLVGEKNPIDLTSVGNMDGGRAV
ncbi:ABC transporter permease subunit [Nocardioides sp. dk4132]|uniref:amino acid ABC transporter permease n=1 Tax=unclassified Nocardioides TaxID=2615069 RepID=UPI0012957F75|nr:MULTISPECIES: amino acid ABC transporter permease [unclassified Nocardioides]MQW76111.1 ABC transporter permease subunit [Nocardioides sp. dk4132]QGA08956.1 ABC transporter permease subunit [Nocardioides sp. dk884]